MAAVDHDGQLDGPGPAVVGQGVEGGPDGPAREEDIVHQDDQLAGQVAGNGGDGLGQNGPDPDVVAVEGDVEHAHRHRRGLHLLQDLGQPEGEGDATGLESDDDDIVETTISFDDFVGDTGDRPLDVLGSENLDPRNKDPTSRWGQPAFSFGHSGSFSSVRASRDPLHGSQQDTTGPPAKWDEMVRRRPVAPRWRWY
jgi:hypothetical protein